MPCAITSRKSHIFWIRSGRPLSRKRPVRWILDEAAEEAGLAESDEHERKRIDLALRSGDQLLIVEFMRPGLTADWDHLSRCRMYVNLVRDKLADNTQIGIDSERVTGLIVADKFSKKPAVKKEIPELRKSDIFTFEWEALLEESRSRWREFLDILKERGRTTQGSRHCDRSPSRACDRMSSHPECQTSSKHPSGRGLCRVCAVLETRRPNWRWWRC